MIRLPYTVVLLNGNLTTGTLQLPLQDVKGGTLRQQISERHELGDRRFRLYRQRDDEELEVIEEELLPPELLNPPPSLELREQIPSVVISQESGGSARKRRPTAHEQDNNSIAFEESSSICNGERQVPTSALLQFMELEPEPVPFVYGEVKVCRWMKCFSYEMFLELNPEIGVVNLYRQKRDCPKRPKRTIPFLQIQKIVRLKETPCFSRKSYMKLVLPDEQQLSLCFYDKDVCSKWMQFIKQAIIFARYFEERTLKLTERQPELTETLKRTNTSRVELKDSIVSGTSNRKSSNTNRSEQSAPEVFLNQKRGTSSVNEEIVLLEDFEVDRKIGSGSFGYVFLAKHITTGRQFALKQLSKNELVQKRQLRYALTELDVLKRSDNPFIVRLHYAFQTKDYLYMAMTYCPNGTLSTSLIDSEEMIARNGQLSVEDAIIYICELIVAIEFLHDMDVLYRDLKPENLLIGNDYHLLLSDFGLAKTEIGPKDFTESFCGSPLYVSPEMLVHGKANRMSDIYGIGAVMYEMVHGHTLFECEDIGEAFQKIKTEQPKINQDLPEELQDFLRCTLDKRPERRPKRIRDHPLFDNVNWRHVQQKRFHPSVQFDRQGSSLEWVQIDYKIDEDYNHLNYQENRVEGWLFSTNTSAG